MSRKRSNPTPVFSSTWVTKPVKEKINRTPGEKAREVLETYLN